MKRVLIVGSQHGNELLGERLYAHITRQPRCSDLEVTHILANPKARQQGLRFVESDMNRSFGLSRITYEEQQAAEVLKHINGRDFDLVLDAHTTTVDQQPCIVVRDIADETCAFLRASHINNIVLMRHDFIGRSLIGHVPQAVSIEVSNAQLGESLYKKLYDDMRAYAQHQTTHPKKQLFVVEELLKKQSVPADQAQKLQNFKLSLGGLYPILVGEEAYAKQTDYLGFIAKTKQDVTV